MLKFYRKIRQKLITENKISKYLIYAIGEIVLVVIGILIALSINNWNQDRITRNVEKQLVQQVLKDLEADNLRLSENLKEAENVLEVYKQLYEIGVAGNQDIPITRPDYVRRIIVFDASMNKNYSAISERIANPPIRASLQAHDLVQKRLEVVFLEYKKVIEDRMRIFLGEKGLYELESLFNNPGTDKAFINKEKLKSLAKTIPFQQLLFEAQLKLDNIHVNLKRVLESNAALITIIKENMTYYQ